MKPGTRRRAIHVAAFFTTSRAASALMRCEYSRRSTGALRTEYTLDSLFDFLAWARKTVSALPEGQSVNHANRPKCCSALSVLLADLETWLSGVCSRSLSFRPDFYSHLADYWRRTR